MGDECGEGWRGWAGLLLFHFSPQYHSSATYPKALASQATIFGRASCFRIRLDLEAEYARFLRSVVLLLLLLLVVVVVVVVVVVLLLLVLVVLLLLLLLFFFCCL